MSEAAKVKLRGRGLGSGSHVADDWGRWREGIDMFRHGSDGRAIQRVFGEE